MHVFRLLSMATAASFHSQDDTSLTALDDKD
jgi:hypothetical protein